MPRGWSSPRIDCNRTRLFIRIKIVPSQRLNVSIKDNTDKITVGMMALAAMTARACQPDLTAGTTASGHPTDPPHIAIVLASRLSEVSQECGCCQFRVSQ
jgi:hypothetical protein